jgi:hypothetical protein
MGRWQSELAKFLVTKRGTQAILSASLFAACRASCGLAVTKKEHLCEAVVTPRR